MLLVQQTWLVNLYFSQVGTLKITFFDLYSDGQVQLNSSISYRVVS